jgi:5-formaminoimidazole-4-carboxamide-1-(beta)-D-ribofuranosyl 5'-monophosphate synthetase
VNATGAAAALARYDRAGLTLCSIGSHSALDVAFGARACGLRNLVVTARGREQTYARHYVRRGGDSPGDPARGCVDETLALERFSDILDDAVQGQLLARNAIFVPNRSFEVYLHQRYSYDEIERGMRVPMFGNRALLRAEERDEDDNQYALLERAGVRYPRAFAAPAAIDRLVMVKAPHAQVSFERAFFLCDTPQEYERQAERLLAAGIVSEDGLRGARIEEYALGPSVNLNFFASPLLGEVELLGTDTRRQTNLEGLRSLPPAQLAAAAAVPVRMEEAGHIATTLTESMLEQAYAMGERFVAAARAASAPGVIGPFALQCIIVAGPPKEFVVYDVSLRIPGSPGTRYTPYSAYLWGRDVSVGERIAMEVVLARDQDRLGDILT